MAAGGHLPAFWPTTTTTPGGGRAGRVQADAQETLPALPTAVIHREPAFRSLVPLPRAAEVAASLPFIALGAPGSGAPRCAHWLPASVGPILNLVDHPRTPAAWARSPLW